MPDSTVKIRLLTKKLDRGKPTICGQSLGINAINMQKLNFEKGRPIVILPYQKRWVQEFQIIGKNLRKVLGNSVLRIDHIGSTAVPNLGAKDVIDVQITVENLQAKDFKQQLKEAQYQMSEDIFRDNLVGIKEEDENLKKCFCRERKGDRRTHIHIRQMGHLNQRYPLVFRDYLRASDTTRLGYETLKNRLAQLFPESLEGYLFIKDPLMDIIFEAAQHWAKTTNWQMDKNHY